MPTNPVQTYGNKIVQPLMAGEEITEIPVGLKASTVFAAGTVVGELLGTVDVQTLHQTAALTGGAFSLNDGVNTSPSIAFNASNSDVQAALNAATPGPIIYNVTSGGPLSGGSPADIVLTRQAAGVQALMTLATNTTTGGTFSVVHTTSGTAPSNGTYAPYASGNSDGSQNPRGILRYPYSTDANGVITCGGDMGVVVNQAVLCFSGVFRIQDLVGLDSTAVTRLGARIIEGAVNSNGIIVLPGV